MQDITELQRRLTAALDRIGAGLDGLDRAGESTVAEPSAEVDGPAAELDGARARAAALETEMARARDALAAVEQDRARLKAANDALTSSNRMLQQAVADGLSDPGLVDAALKTELEALRAAHASDRAELDAIVALLEPTAEKDEEAGENA